MALAVKPGQRVMEQAGIGIVDETGGFDDDNTIRLQPLKVGDKINSPAG